ncbi:MAG: hypothetical protein EAZ92_00615, partial [Candidatus Kapaibacterium sp.]
YDKDQLRYKPKGEAVREAALEFSEDLKEQPVLKEAAEFEKNVLEQYIKYFGYVAPPFPLLGFDPLAFVPLRNIKSLFKTKGNFAPVRQPLGMQIPKFTNQVGYYYFPNMPMVSVRGSKNVAITEMSRGVDTNGKAKIGTVKENIYMRDYLIDIQGIIIGEKEDELPTDEIRKIMRLCEYGLSLDVEHVLLNALGINMVTIYDFDFPTIEGEGENVQTFMLRCYSDEDFEKELLNG